MVHELLAFTTVASLKGTPAAKDLEELCYPAPRRARNIATITSVTWGKPSNIFDDTEKSKMNDNINSIEDMQASGAISCLSQSGSQCVQACALMASSPPRDVCQLL